jgi:hypothetical protein
VHRLHSGRLVDLFAGLGVVGSPNSLPRNKEVTKVVSVGMNGRAKNADVPDEHRCNRLVAAFLTAPAHVDRMCRKVVTTGFAKANACLDLTPTCTNTIATITGTGCECRDQSVGKPIAAIYPLDCGEVHLNINASILAL